MIHAELNINHQLCQQRKIGLSRVIMANMSQMSNQTEGEMNAVIMICFIGSYCVGNAVALRILFTVNIHHFTCH